ncbi:MAG: Rhodanese-related sulfurtransferase SseA [Candidatus Methanohalarchaeum thermophilum]|uniref:Sulfurtransferase n=1 Tax=Methanohalarchaeum thermophilum TaxID=1903181 RepID=A0A1Q6DU41_METT1|nr:MAG: Rhodanese-related sulfurtransferase SseA [Candidatus Methanohalarchaeum thermophilum]
MDYPIGEGEVKLVSTDWLEKKKKEDIKILDFQPNVHDYIYEHIPGAVYFNEGLFRSAKEGVPGKYVPGKNIENIFRSLGIKKDEPTVVYTGKGEFKGWGDGLEQTMAAYTLARFGHENVYLLDGGLEKWKNEERELTKEYPETKESSFKVEIKEELFLEYREFKRIKDQEDVLLLDARPLNLYEGQGPWMKPGHIPGAVNLPWKNLMQSNPRKLKSIDEVESILEDKGVQRDKKIICSCGTGREATNEFTLLNWYLDYPDVYIYEGSFTEWCAYPDNKTITGEKPR